MHLLTGLVICTFVVQRSSCYLDLEDWDNNFDEKLDFKCPFRNQFISTVVSVHHNGAEDRRFKLNCRNIISGGRGDQDASCEDSGYVNDWDGVVNFQCPGDGYINGMQSVHDNWTEDRRWSFYCCSMPGYSPFHCKQTGWTNDFDRIQNYRVPDGFIMTGVYSEHDNGPEDRRFKYRICRAGVK
ncbi:hemagglutinin/amebocyte aggregation factor-like [Dreissena polymorpha]|uniref:Dermatopontin n=1 Tax=Dreissena polymorpha TaxID=45954 RepID=A0A9D3YH99_DREPO|nr:hemagglutinin/amebocyte aggregation factor-like [Dreissena polymorpha]KAH3699265.1 hypothetical protein DPMN_074221 [Dreissena polymorpha]